MKRFLTQYALLPLVATLMACGGDKKSGEEAEGQEKVVASQETPMTQVTVGSKTYTVADIDDNAAEYKTNVNKKNCFFIISKKEYRIYVYEVVNGDTVLAAHYPVCYAKNPENKQGKGDFRTPESTMQEPFTISEIKDATTWCHDFGDGRGEIKAYGAWFMRLKTPPHTGIGIHGSTNNVESVPGRDSEGCIRLRDADLNRLHDVYAQEGTKVIIKGIKEGKLPFEQKAEKALGNDYKAPKPGNPFAKGGAAKSNAKQSAAPAATNDNELADPMEKTNSSSKEPEVG